MASAVTMPPTIINALMATMNTPSDSSAIEVAATGNAAAFRVYILWLFISSVISIVFTWWLWSSSNRQTDAITVHFKGRAAELEKEAAAARTKQAEFETKLEEQRQKTEEQRERAAKSEKALLDLVKEPRSIDSKLADEILTPGAKSAVFIIYDGARDEVLTFVNELEAVLRQHGWTINPSVTSFGNVMPPGIQIVTFGDKAETVSNPMDMEGTPAGAMYKFLTQAVKGNAVVTLQTDPRLSKDLMKLVVGAKY